MMMKQHGRERTRLLIEEVRWRVDSGTARRYALRRLIEQRGRGMRILDWLD
jgi:hypothetical protein